MAARKQYQLLVWGATGFTGGLVTRYLATHYKDLSWAIAGRSEAKLKRLRDDLQKIAPECGRVGIEVATASDREALDAIVRKTSVVLATVGPFVEHGEPLVAACVHNGVDYADITGEVFWVNRMARKYGEAAAERGARIISCCGFDSVPADIGTYYVAEHARRQYGARLAGVRAVVKARVSPSGGTIATILGFPKHQSLRDMSEPYFEPPIRYVQSLRCWAAPFIMATTNAAVVRRSAEQLAGSDEELGPRFRYRESMHASSLITAVFHSIAVLLLALVVLLPPLRWVAARVLLKPGEGPSAEERARNYFVYRFVADLDPPSGSTGGRVPARIVASMSGGDPGYTETATMLAEAGLAMALEKDKLPRRAGFLTPAAGLGAPYLARLRAAGLVFALEREEFQD